jgi:hypothetical protein
MLHGVNPLDQALRLRVIRYRQARPAAVDVVGHALDTIGVFSRMRLTDMGDTQPLDANGNPD